MDFCCDETGQVIHLIFNGTMILEIFEFQNWIVEQPTALAKRRPKSLSACADLCCLDEVMPSFSPAYL